MNVVWVLIPPYKCKQTLQSHALKYTTLGSLEVYSSGLFVAVSIPRELHQIPHSLPPFSISQPCHKPWWCMFDVLPLAVAIMAKLTLQRQDICVCAASMANLEFALVLLPPGFVCLENQSKRQHINITYPLGNLGFMICMAWEQIWQYRFVYYYCQRTLKS